MMASPAKCNASQERCAASAWPPPQASSITTGMIPRSAAWRAVGSMPISIAMPTMASAPILLPAAFPSPKRAQDSPTPTQQNRYSSCKYEIKLLSVDGAKVATIQHLRLRKRNDDRVVQLEVAEFFTLRGGRILEHRGFFDSFDFVQQLLGQDLTDAFAASVRNAMRG